MADVGVAAEAARRRRRGESELVSIDSVHQQIHDGLFYSSGLNDPLLAGGASLDVLFRVVGGAHVRVSTALGGDGIFEGFFDTTVSAPGTAVPIFNRNRFSQNVANNLVFSGPTITTLGTRPVEQFIFGGSGGNAVGGGLDTFLEWVLTPADYLMRLTNSTGQVHRASISFDWYEKDGS